MASPRVSEVKGANEVGDDTGVEDGARLAELRDILFGAAKAELEAHVSALDNRLTAELGSMRTEMAGLIDRIGAETKRAELAREQDRALRSSMAELLERVAERLRDG